MDNIESIASKFKNFIDLQKFCDKQHRIIIDLQKQLADLQKDNVLLKLRLSELPSIPETKENLIVEVSDEETICRTQLKLFRDIAMVRELSMEETKKIEVFAKLLLSLDQKKKEDKPKTGQLTSEELMSLLSNESNTTTN